VYLGQIAERKAALEVTIAKRLVVDRKVRDLETEITKLRGESYRFKQEEDEIREELIAAIPSKI
jgi:hypothetical protein